MRAFHWTLLCCLGAGAAAPSFAAGKPACDLLTKADVESALGVPVAEPQNQVAPSPAKGENTSICYFRAAKSGPGVQKTLYLTASYTDVAHPAAVSNVRKTLKTSSQYRTVRDVAGVGDVAIWATAATMKMGQLHFFKGGTVHFTLTITGIPEDAAALAKAKALALKALGRT